MDNQKPLEKIMTLEDQLDLIGSFFKELPFNVTLGLDITYLRSNGAGMEFPMKNDLIGNKIHGNMHGGVISAVLDTTGGATAIASAVEKMQGLSLQEVANRISQIGTIDMRVDYLRPGRGTYFYSTGTVMRTGKKIAVTRMELKNEKNLLIAVGTGTYIVG